MQMRLSVFMYYLRVREVGSISMRTRVNIEHTFGIPTPRLVSPHKKKQYPDATFVALYSSVYSIISIIVIIDIVILIWQYYYSI